MKFKTFWNFSLTDETDREYLKTSGAFEYAGRPKNKKDSELVRLVLNRAAMIGDTGTVLYLIENGAAVRGKQVEALPLAIDAGHQDIAVALIQAGADVSLVDKDTKQTLLHRAALKGQSRTCQALIATKNIKLDARNAQGSTPLHCAAAVGDERTIQLLVAAGACRKKKNSHANTPAHLAKLNGHLNVLKYLEKGAITATDALPPTDPLAARITRIE